MGAMREALQGNSIPAPKLVLHQAGTGPVALATMPRRPANRRPSLPIAMVYPSGAARALRVYAVEPPVTGDLRLVLLLPVLRSASEAQNTSIVGKRGSPVMQSQR
jgi:hypothetical protein